MLKKKETVAMLLAGGQGSRLYTLTEGIAQPAVLFGGTYRIIDFPLSNCINSGIDTVGVLTQYQPLVLNEYIGNGQPWDLDRANGGVTVLPPYQANKKADWYKGTANAIYQNLHFISRYDPDYVIIGETAQYNYENITRAMRLINNGAKLIGTNTDLTGPSETGPIPACRALVAPIERTTGKQAYYVGKPNPLMMRTGLRILGVHSEDTAMIGDRMDTDIIAGIESGLDPILVLTGVTNMTNINDYPYRPRLILKSIGDIAK